MPAVAGQFYPGGTDALATAVDRLLDAASVDGTAAPDGTVAAAEPLAAAYVVPHAGYRYSGPTAARVYARLRGYADEIRRIVLIGPAHHVPLAGCAAPSRAIWLTPLGGVPLDTATIRALADGGLAAIDDRPHEPEHSLEVQLPFLQRVLPAGVPIVPLLVGRSRTDEAAAALDAATAAPGTLVLCSTDLSHYQEQAAAQSQDGRTAQAVLDLAAERVGVRDACGFFALRGLLAWARLRGLTPRLLHLCTSADATGDPSRVVGYGAFAFQAQR